MWGVAAAGRNVGASQPAGVMWGGVAAAGRSAPGNLTAARPDRCIVHHERKVVKLCSLGPSM